MSNYKIYQNVDIGKNVTIEDFVIIGKPPTGKKDGELTTIIGDNAVIRSNTVIYAGNVIGDNFQTGHHVTIRELNQMGDNVSIGTSSCIEHHISIEDGVRLHSQTFIPEFSRLEEGCWIGPNVVLTNSKYPQAKNSKDKLAGPVLKRGAIIGANSTILPGIIIEERALVGAGTTVIKNVPAGKVMVGNPGRIIGSRDEIEDYDNQEDELNG